MKSPTEIHSNSAIELQVYHLITCYHNFCIMSLLSRQQSFPLQVKRICRDSSFVTLMSFSAKLSLPARFFSHCFGSHGRTLNYFCNRLRFTYCQAIRHVISVESWQVESWPSNHVWKSGCIHSNEISCKMALLDWAINEMCSSQPRGVWQLKRPHPSEFAIQGKKMLMPGNQPGGQSGGVGGRGWDGRS